MVEGIKILAFTARIKPIIGLAWFIMSAVQRQDLGLVLINRL